MKPINRYAVFSLFCAVCFACSSRTVEIKIDNPFWVDDSTIQTSAAASFDESDNKDFPREKRRAESKKAALEIAMDHLLNFILYENCFSTPCYQSSSAEMVLSREIRDFLSVNTERKILAEKYDNDDACRIIVRYKASELRESIYMIIRKSKNDFSPE